MIDFSKLNSQFSDVVQQLIENCQKEGYHLVPYVGLRSLSDQAKLWRISRPTTVINQEIDNLRQQGCDYLASVLEAVGIQPAGTWKTNAIPGLSWHNWCEACDFYWLQENGTVNWSGTSVGYKILGQEAAKLHLTWGGNFKSKPDYGHVQLRSQEIPDLYTIQEVNDYFEKLNSQ